jgi:hypothetical protein
MSHDAMGDGHGTRVLSMGCRGGEWIPNGQADKGTSDKPLPRKGFTRGWIRQGLPARRSALGPARPGSDSVDSCARVSVLVFAHALAQSPGPPLSAARPRPVMPALPVLARPGLPLYLSEAKGVSRKPRVGRNSSLSKTTDILKNCFPSKTFSGDFVYQLREFLRHGPGRGDEAVEGRQASIRRHSVGRGQRLADPSGKARTRRGSGKESRHDGPVSHSTTWGVLNRRCTSASLHLPGGPSLPRRRGSRGIHCSVSCVGDLTSGRPPLHVTQTSCRVKLHVAKGGHGGTTVATEDH